MTQTASSRLNNSAHKDRCDNRSHRSPNRRKVLRAPEDQQAPRRCDRSLLRPRGLHQQIRYKEYYPRRAETYYKSGSPTAGYRRVRSSGDINPSFLQRRRYDVITRCRAFSSDLRAVHWPSRFRQGNMEKFDGSQNPIEFLQIYMAAAQAGGGGERVMANYLPTVLKGSARSWLLNQPLESIYS